MQIAYLKYALCFAACGISVTFAEAGTPKIHTAKMAPDGTHVWVQFETPVALTDCDVEYKSSAAGSMCKSPLPSAPWVVVVYDKSGKDAKIQVTTASDILGHLPANGLVQLELERKIEADFSRVDITFTNAKGGSFPHFSIEKATPPTTKWVTAAKTKDDSNLYISGTFAPASGSSPSYTIDSKASYTVYSFAMALTQSQLRAI